MQFDKWFYSQSKLVQVILLILPVVGWIMEILVRLSVMLRTKSLLHIIIFVVIVIFGIVPIFHLIDLIVLLVTGKLLLAE